MKRKTKSPSRDLKENPRFEKIVHMTPAFDERDPDPKKNRGINGVELRMVLKGPEGAVQFVIFTNWQLPHITKESHERILHEKVTESLLRCLMDPTPADLGYHSPKPMFDGQKPAGSEEINFEKTVTLRGATGPLRIPTLTETGTFTPCEYLDNRPCYYDGSTLAADKIYEILLREGSDGVWRKLRDCYDRVFGNK